MDELKIITNIELYREHLAVLNYPPELQRIYFYSSKAPRFTYESRKVTDTHIYWSMVERIPMFENGIFFYRRKAHHGVTYDRKKKTTKIWFGDNLNKLPHGLKTDCLELLAPWVLKKVSNSLMTLINNTMFSKIINGKIKNTTELVEAYLKTSPYKNMDVDVKLFLKVFGNKNSYQSVKSFKDLLLCASNINDAIKYVQKQVSKHYIHSDALLNLSPLANMLGIKIDVKMSHKNAVELYDELKTQVAKNIIIYKNIEDVN